jgi:hypothetical protein
MVPDSDGADTNSRQRNGSAQRNWMRREMACVPRSGTEITGEDEGRAQHVLALRSPVRRKAVRNTIWI